MEGFSATISTLWENIVNGGALMIRTTTYKIAGWDMGETMSTVMFIAGIVLLTLFVACKLKRKPKVTFLMEDGQLHHLQRRR